MIAWITDWMSELDSFPLYHLYLGESLAPGCVAGGNGAHPQSCKESISDPRMRMRGSGKTYRSWSKFRGLSPAPGPGPGSSAPSCCGRSPAWSSPSPEEGQGPEMLCHGLAAAEIWSCHSIQFSPCQSVVQLSLLSCAARLASAARPTLGAVGRLQRENTRTCMNRQRHAAQRGLC